MTTYSGKTVKENKASIVYTVDSYADGISFGKNRINSAETWRDELALDLLDEEDLLRFRRRFTLDSKNTIENLECELMNLSERGILSRAHIVLGTTTDPFFPFDNKFDCSMKFLSLFQRYIPGLLTVQTRSPLIVLAMPILKKLGKHAAVTMCIETNDEDAIRRYTPGLPRAAERLKAARALRSFGVDVTLQVAPVLPYGDWRKDAALFAEELIGAGDSIYIRCLLDGANQTVDRQQFKNVAKALARDRKFHWLRKDSANPLTTAIGVLSPEKLKLGSPIHLEERQLNMFAA